MNKPLRLQDWDKLPEESDGDYVKFGCYLNLGYGRNLNSAALLLEGKETVTKGNKIEGKSRFLNRFQKLSSRHRWIERAQAFDLHCLENARSNMEAIQTEIYYNHLKLLLNVQRTITESLKEAVNDENWKKRFINVVNWGILVNRKSQLTKFVHEGIMLTGIYSNRENR